MADAEAAAARPAWTLSEKAAHLEIEDLLRRKKVKQALAVATQAIGLFPRSWALTMHRGLTAERLIADDPDHATAYSRIALDAFTRAREFRPDDPGTAASLARVLDRRGEGDLARRTLEPFLAGAETDRDIVSIFVRTAARSGEGERAVELARAAIARPGGGDDIRLLHALARLLDKLGRYEESFAVAAQGNEAFARRQLPVNFRPGELGVAVDKMIAATPRAAMAAAPVARDRSELPVFIVGMGRSGTTLVEQIIAGHPEAHGSGERRALAKIALTLAKATGKGYPAGVTTWPVDALDRAAESYLAALARIAPQARRITDKLPQNFLRLPIIQRLLPGARVIHCQRNPIDVCLSAYYQEDKIPVMEAWDLARSGLAYRNYERLMAHWLAVLDLPILNMRYESLVMQPEVEARRIIAFLGLPWDDRCLAVERNRRVVDTSNYAAVRGPIHGEAVDRWMRYRTQLKPLIDTLTGMRSPGPV